MEDMAVAPKLPRPIAAASISPNRASMSLVFLMTSTNMYSIWADFNGE